MGYPIHPILQAPSLGVWLVTGLRLMVMLLGSGHPGKWQEGSAGQGR